MDERDRQHLGDIVDHAQAAVGYARSHGSRWWKNRETLDAVLMRISQIGEAAGRTSPETLAAVTGVAWREVKAMRSKIVHDYQAIDVPLVRGVVSRQLPRLITIVAKALAEDAGPSGKTVTRPPPVSGGGW